MRHAALGALVLLVALPVAARAQLRLETITKSIQVLEDGSMVVERSRRVFDGDELLGEKTARLVLTPEMRPDEIGDERAKAIARVIWTAKVVADFRAKADAARTR